jgi:hypothetical protein
MMDRGRVQANAMTQRCLVACCPQVWKIEEFLTKWEGIGRDAGDHARLASYSTSPFKTNVASYPTSAFKPNVAPRFFLTQRSILMRPQVWKIEDFLTKWEGSCSGASANDPGKAAIALVLLQEIDTYRCVHWAVVTAVDCNCSLCAYLIVEQCC